MKTNIICRIYNALYIIMILFGILFTSGCSGGGTEVGNPPYTYDAWEELADYIKGQYSETVLASIVYTDRETWGAAFESQDISTSPAGGVDYSQTNVQETGVDESDKVKTDGEYIYVADDQAVHIVNAVPANYMEVVSTINVNGAVDSLYLYGDVLIILYTPYGGEGSQWSWAVTVVDAMIGIPYWIPVQAQTGVMMMDISEPSSPEWIKEVAIDGWLVSSRITGGRLHIIQQFMPDLPPLQMTYDGTEAGKAAAIAANEQALASVTIDDLIPSYETFNAQDTPISSGRLIVPDDFCRPDDPAGGSIVSVVTFNLENMSERFKSVGLIADAHTVYASTHALYIASTQQNYNADYKTVLHKFSLTGEDVTLEGAGDVPGRILNQFSLGEYEDVLRIATNNGKWGIDSLNYVYCLEDTGDRLEIIGKLEGIAPGEDIYSARFIGTRGFLVTYIKIDPLFTLDLSNPYNPVVAGELKVPGYSDYIHPLGEDHLITIGKDTILDNGFSWYQGLQLSIFDVSDFENPELKYKELIGDRGTSSEALYNHKAFTFWAEGNLLAIPVDLYEHPGVPVNPYDWVEYIHSGLYVYRVTVQNGFEYLGCIITATGKNYPYTAWLRGLFIGEDVYAVNNEAVRSANIGDMGTVNTVYYEGE
jgi:inhibitor of cysteine peptidase